jgi:RNA polymerase sigma factor (sigma-70 family)
MKQYLFNKKILYENDTYKKNDNYKKIVNYYVSVCEDISDVKKNLNMPVRKKQKRKLQRNDKTVIIYPLKYLNNVENYQDKIVLNTQDKILAWQIRNVIEEELTDRQKQIFEMYYFKDMTQQEIADKFKITREAITQNLKNIRAFIKKNI